MCVCVFKWIYKVCTCLIYLNHICELCLLCFHKGQLSKPNLIAMAEPVLTQRRPALVPLDDLSQNRTFRGTPVSTGGGKRSKMVDTSEKRSNHRFCWLWFTLRFNVHHGFGCLRKKQQKENKHIRIDWTIRNTCIICPCLLAISVVQVPSGNLTSFDDYHVS